MTKSNASFNAREWAMERLIPSSAWPHQGGLTWRKRLSTAPTVNAKRMGCGPLIPPSRPPHQEGLTWQKRLSMTLTFNARRWAVDCRFHQVSHLIIKEGLLGRIDWGITWQNKLSMAPAFNAMEWAVDCWFRQVCDPIKKGLTGRKKLSMAPPSFLILEDGLWTADSAKCSTSSRSPLYLAE
jgi:hypothetical protein